MKILHTADIHHDPRFRFNTLPAMAQINQIARDCDPDAIVIAGDLFHNRDRLDPTSVYEMRQFVRDCTISPRGTRPVIIIPGNHDTTNAADRIDSVSAVFDMPGAINEIAGARIFSTPEPEIVATLDGPIIVAPLPTPNKYHYRAYTGDDPTNKQLAEELKRMMRAMANYRNLHAPELPLILVYHGTIEGGRADSEQVMTTGIDIAVPQDALSGFDAVMCGHLHRHQAVGLALYSGSPTALNFHQQEPYYPGVVMWELAPAPGVMAKYDFIELDVEHRFYQFEFQDADYGLAKKRPECVAGGIVKITGEIDGDLEAVRQQIAKDFPEAREVRPEIRRKAIETGDDKIDLAEPIDGLLRRWLAMQEITEESDVIDVCAAAGKVKEMLGEKALTELETKTFEPLVLSIKDWCQFESARIDFRELPALVNLSGDNKSGKTNLALAEPFALFGWLRPGSAIRDYVRAGEKQAEVTYIFRARGRTFRIERNLKRAPTGRVTGEVFFSELLPDIAPETWESCNEASAGATNLAIVDLVGGVDSYFRTVFARQNKIDEILDMKPAEMKTAVQTALGARRYWLFQQTAKELNSSLGKDLAGVSESIKRNGELIDIEVAVRAEMETLAGQVATLTELNDTDKESRAGVQTAITQKSELRAELTARLKTYNAIGQELTRLADEKTHFDKIIADLDALEKSRGDIEMRLAEISLREAEEIERDKANAEDTRLSQEIAELGAEMKIEHEKYQSAINQLKQQIERAKKDVKRLEDVPCQTVFDSSDIAERLSPEYFDSCRFLTDAAKARDSLPELELNLTATKGALAGAGSRDAIKIKALESFRKTFGFNERKLANVKARLRVLRSEKWPEKAATCAAAAAKRESAREACAMVEDRIAKKMADRETHEVNEEQFSELKSQINELGNESGRLEKMIELRAGEIIAKEREIGGRQERIEQSEKARRDNAELEKKSLYLVREITAFERFIDATGRDGIPLLKLRETVPRIEQLANDLLGDTPVSIVIDPERELVSGDYTDALDVRFRDYRGDFALSMASGFDRFMLALALRYALALIEAESAGASVKGFWIDEGFGVIRHENLVHAREMLTRIARDFERVIFITHIESLKVIAEQRIEVIDNELGNTVKLVS